jgi:hypothetical protein
MLTNNDNHDISDPIEEELNSIQREIIHEIRKTQNIMIFQMLSLILFALFNGGFFVPYITFDISGNVLIPRIFIAFFFFIAVIRSASKFSPYLCKGYKILREIEQSDSNGKFKSGIIHYIAEFYELSKHGKNKYCSEKQGDLIEKIPKVFLWELIAFLIIGVLLIGYDVALLGWYPSYTPFGLNIGLFSATVTFYLVLVLLTLILKRRSDKWLAGFQHITQWGENIEKTSIKSTKGE